MTTRETRSITTWDGSNPVAVKADEEFAGQVGAAIVACLGGTFRARQFVRNSGIDVLLAAHIERYANSVHHAEAYDHRSADPTMQQALGIVQAYFSAGHNGILLFKTGLPKIVFDEFDTLGFDESSCVRTHFERGARLLGHMPHFLPQGMAFV